MTDPKQMKQQDLLAERKRRILSSRTLVLTFVSVAVITLLIYQVDVEQMVGYFSRADLKIVALSMLIYGISNLMKAIRLLRVMRLPFGKLARMFEVVSYHNFFNHILPARTGELTLVYYLNKKLKLPVSENFHALISVRFMDLSAVALFFIVSIMIYAGNEASPLLLGLALVVGVLSLAVTFFLPALIRFGSTLVLAVSERLFSSPPKVVVFMNDKFLSLKEAFSGESERRYSFSAVVVSLFVWLALYTFAYVNILVFEYPITYLQTVVGATGMVLTNVLPVNGFGSFGSLEAGWTGGFYLVGMPMDIAVITGIGYHVINFIASLFYAIISRIIAFFLDLRR